MRTTTTIRVTRHFVDRLKNAASAEGSTMQELLEHALDLFCSQCQQAVDRPQETTVPVSATPPRQPLPAMDTFEKMKAREAMLYREWTSLKPLKR